MLCELCQSLEVEWVHELDPARSSFRQYGKGHIWASRVYVCDRCDRLFRDRDVEALVSLQVGQTHLAPVLLTRRFGIRSWSTAAPIRTRLRITMSFLQAFVRCEMTASCR